MGNEWWGRRYEGDKDDWCSNWDNQLSSKEHRAVGQGSEDDRVEGQGSEEDCGEKQGSEEHSLTDLRVKICMSFDLCEFQRGDENRCKRWDLCLRRPSGL